MYSSLEELCCEAEEKNCALWELVLQDDMQQRGVSRRDSFAATKALYLTMKKADEDYEQELLSHSRLVGGDGEKLARARREGWLYWGDFIGRVMETAVKMGESNACMKKIVAAPTAGSCGVMPAVLLNLQREKGFTDDRMTEAMFVAAGIGGVIANRAFLAGASGGCQAEIGSASAMAAGAAAYLAGGDARRIAAAAALALKSLLGLACDPVAGLVEVPCVKRNVIGSVNALTAADMAMAGIDSRIPPDEVIDAMKSIGICMPACLKETGTGGLAATPTGEKIREQMA